MYNNNLASKGHRYLLTKNLKKYTSLSTYIKLYRQLYTVKQNIIKQEQFTVSKSHTKVHKNSNLHQIFRPCQYGFS